MVRRPGDLGKKKAALHGAIALYTERDPKSDHLD
jgi:hypothetical protein